MKELLTYLITEITGSDQFEIDEHVENEKINLEVRANPSIVGLIIGKQGKTIKTLRKILSIKATNDNTVVSISVI